MHESLLDPIDPRSYKYLPLWQHKKETKGDVQIVSKLRGWKRKHRAEICRHLLMLTRLTALNTGDHMHHHKVSNMNPSPGEDRVHNESLEVGDLVSMSSMWQENRTDHMVKDSASHCQAVSRWFAHPLRIPSLHNL